jgi:beta-galactosidase GanA
MRLVALALAASAAAADPGVITYDSLGGLPYSVTYDNRSLFINGERSLFFSFGMHYTRATQAQWDDLLAKAASDGYTSACCTAILSGTLVPSLWKVAHGNYFAPLYAVVQTYVFWNAHQHKPGDWDFEGPLGNNYNLTAFLERASAHGLFVNLRIGPYVCAEWNFGKTDETSPRLHLCEG